MNRDCKTLKLILTSLVAMAFSTHAYAAVAIFDGFGDADINNNGVALESDDVNVAEQLPTVTPIRTYQDASRTR